VGLPEAVLVEALPDGVLLDMEDEVGVDIRKLDDLGLADGGDGVAARAHASAVDLVAGVDDGDVADHGAALFGEDMELFAECAEGDLEVFEDLVGLGLVVEGFFFGALDGVEALVEHAAEAGGFALGDEVADALAVEECLHEEACLAEVEELAGGAGGAHLEDAAGLVPFGVGGGAGGDIELGLASGEGGFDDGVGEGLEGGGGFFVAVGPGGIPLRGRSGQRTVCLLGVLFGHDRAVPRTPKGSASIAGGGRRGASSTHGVRGGGIALWRGALGACGKRTPPGSVGCSGGGSGRVAAARAPKLAIGGHPFGVRGGGVVGWWRRCLVTWGG